MLTLSAPQVESLFDEALPIEVRALPPDLARLDELLGDPVLLAPIADGGGRQIGAASAGRPTIAMSLFVRLMVVKQRAGWGYETLVREVSDSFHLRRFVGLSVHARGAARVDDPQAGRPAWGPRRRRDHTGGDRQGGP